MSDCWQPCLGLTAVLLVSLFLSLRCRVRVHPSSALPCSPLLVSLFPLTLSHTITKHILRGASTHCKPSALSRCNDDDGRIDRMEVEKASTSLVVVVDRVAEEFYSDGCHCSCMTACMQAGNVHCPDDNGTPAGRMDGHGIRDKKSH